MGQQRPNQNLIGESPEFLDILERLSQVASLSRPVLLVGERGTGKEVLAERLHYLSGRWEQPFLKLNCAALPESLLEAELFGHEAGAFTGATGKREGRFELADGGTLFLDELANTPMAVQEKILRVIEYGEFERIGSARTHRVDVRLVGATNEDLPALTREGRFRADLLDRLAFDVLTVPPLRARTTDIVPLAEHFATRMAADLEHSHFPGFSKSAIAALLRYSWPGNVRELKNVVERAVYRNADPAEALDDFEFDPFDSPWRPGSEPEGSESPACPDTSYDFRAQMESTETRLLQDALRRCHHNQKDTAEFLQMTYHQLRGLLRKYDLVGNSEDEVRKSA